MTKKGNIEQRAGTETGNDEREGVDSKGGAVPRNDGGEGVDSRDCFVPRNDNKPSLRGGTKNVIAREARPRQSAPEEYVTNRLPRSARNDDTKQPTARIPQLRFKEFDGEWEVKKLGEIYKINAGGDIDKNNVSQIKTKKHKYPIYANARKGKGFYAYSDIYKVEPNTITIAGRGAHLGIAHARDHRFYPIVRLLVLKPLKKENIHFGECAINRINLFIESTGVPQLTAPQISGYKIHLPSLPEQQKIATFLSAVDKKIQQLSKKKALLEAYKKGVMQQLFSGQLRFKPDPTNETSLRGTKQTQSLQNETKFPDWEEKRLGEVCQINPRSKDLPFNFIYIDLESVKDGQLIKENRINLIDAPSRAQRLLVKDDILYQTVRPYQKNNLFFDRNGDHVASTGYAQLRVTESSMYIFQLMHFDGFVNKVLVRCTGTSYPAINSNDLAKIYISIPCIEEQQKIASYLSSIDTKIETVSQQISQTQRFKKGLLQQLFV